MEFRQHGRSHFAELGELRRRQRFRRRQSYRQRIAMDPPESEFIVQVRTGGEAGHADKTDGRPLSDVLPDLDVGESRHVTVQRRVLAFVLDDDDVAVAIL